MALLMEQNEFDFPTSLATASKSIIMYNNYNIIIIMIVRFSLRVVTKPTSNYFGSSHC